MKTIFTLLILLSIFTIASSQAVLRITKVDPVTHQVTITNMGNATQNAATWNLCRFPDYDPLSSMLSLSGSTNIVAGGSLTVIWQFCNGADGEVGLYMNASNFGLAANMRDYMEWGFAGHTRETVAVAGGYWTAGQFVPNDPEFNYTGTSTQHGSAFWTHETLGCTYPLACNFDIDATVEDGTCDFNSCTGCTSTEACNFDGTATLDDGTCEYASCRGCTSNEACNFDATATKDDGSCEFISCAGCTSSEACNFNAAASYDNGSCEYASCRGCTSSEACNFDPTATKDDGSCEFVSCAGCTYSAATNFDPAATIDDGSCLYPPVNDCPTDFNNDNTTSTPDLLVFLGAFGTICP